MIQDVRIGVIGLGYVGLPLSAAFAKHFPVCGFDTHEPRVQDINQGIDRTHELETKRLNELLQRGFRASCNATVLKNCNVFIITVPTPINNQNQPDLDPLRSASRTVAQCLKPGDLVIYESTTYPGCTEEVCIPLLEEGSQLKLNRDFHVGYSPERINPGDKTNTLQKVVKITSGSNEEAASRVDALYKTIIQAGTHLAESIKVAEAAKAIENAQRDVNISFVNELSLIFDKMGIDTYEVLSAAQTKWNFLPFKPGLVGGHCIGVDPHYLAYKAQQLGHEPQVISSGRKVNQSMAHFVVNKLIRFLDKQGIAWKGKSVNLLGITFKENCPDTRNSPSVEVYHLLEQQGFRVLAIDPWADSEAVLNEYGIALQEDPSRESVASLLTVAHRHFHNLNWNTLSQNHVVFDTKGVLPKDCVHLRL